MSRARDIADSASVINHLDDVSSSIQTQLDNVVSDRFEDVALTSTQTLVADSHYFVGNGSSLAAGATITIPADTLVTVRRYGYGKSLTE